jgi:hypothetical protein
MSLYGGELREELRDRRCGIQDAVTWLRRLGDRLPVHGSTGFGTRACASEKERSSLTRL